MMPSRPQRAGVAIASYGRVEQSSKGPGAAYLEQAASDADQLAAEAIASSTRPAYESDFFTAWCSELVWTRCQRRSRQ
jgi:hypothetical protein